MNCDQVFAVLTRGPFPSGAAEDALVDEHLDRCTSCWRMAEALRPAHDLFHESLSPAENRCLPGYWGDSMPPGATYDDIAEELRRRPGASSHEAAEQIVPAAIATRRPAPQPVAASLVAYAVAPSSIGPRLFSLLCVGGLMATALMIAGGFAWPFR